MDGYFMSPVQYRTQSAPACHPLGTSLTSNGALTRSPGVPPYASGSSFMSHLPTSFTSNLRRFPIASANVYKKSNKGFSRSGNCCSLLLWLLACRMRVSSVSQIVSRTAKERLPRTLTLTSQIWEQPRQLLTNIRQVQRR